MLENPWDTLETKYKVGSETECRVIKPIEKGIIVELPEKVDSFIPASQLSTIMIKNFAEHFKTGDLLKAKVIEFDKNNKKVVLSVIEFLKDKDQNVIDEYIRRFSLPKKFSVKDIQEKTRSFESEQIDFKIEDIIGDDVPAVNHPPAEITSAKADEVKAPVAEVVTAAVEENAAVVEEIASVVEEKAAVVEEIVPVVEEKAAVIEEIAPVAEENADVVEVKDVAAEEKKDNVEGSDNKEV